MVGPAGTVAAGIGSLQHMEKTTRDVDQYIASLPDDVRHDIEVLDGAIARAMDGSERVLYEGRLWGGSHQEIIGYGTIENTRSDGTTVTWFTVGLAVQKNHLSVYINAVEDRQYLSEKYGAELGKVKVGKSSLGFKSADDIDVGALAKLVERACELTG